MGEIIELDMPTTVDIEPTKVLSGAAVEQSVLVLGWDKDGQFYIASSSADIGGLMLLTEIARRELTEQALS